MIRYDQPRTVDSDGGISSPALAPGKRTLTQGLAPRRAPAPSDAPTEAAAETSSGADTSSHDPQGLAPFDDPFGLHLPTASQGTAPTASAIDAAARAGFGDVSAARLHTGPQAHAMADSIGARAVTIGSDVHFAAGEYQPDTADGAALLGHELAHVAQQRGAAVTSIAAKLRTNGADDHAEHEADDAGATFAAAFQGAQVAPVSLTAAPASIAPQRGRKPGATMNAALKVTAYDQGGKPIETWQSRARWEGALPVHYEGTNTGGRWTWDNSGATSVMVNADDSGRGGRPVQAWAASKKAARVVIHVASLDDVTELDALDLADLRDPKARGRFVNGSDAVGNALPEEHAGDGSSVKVNDDATATAKRRRAPQDGGSTAGDDQQTTGGTGPKTDGPHALPGADTSTGQGDTARDGANTDAPADGQDLDADESGDEEAEADDFDQVLDAEIAQLLADLGQPANGDGNGTMGAGDIGGTTGDNTRPDGYGKGGRGAVYEGAENKSPDANPKGADVADETVGGEVDPTATTSGRPGGEDGGEAGGVLGGSGIGIFGFTISIPESLVGPVEIALIIDDGNIAGFGVGTVRKALEEATEHAIERGVKKGTIAATRRALKREAAQEVAKRMRALRKELAAARRLPAQQLSKRQRALLKEWGQLTREETKRAMRVTAWQMERRFFDETLKAARKEAKTLRRGIRRTKDLGKRADLAHKLKAADNLADAASVKPIAGRLPVNHRYAGQDFPKDKLPPDYRAKGVHVNADGFPEFEPYAMTLPNGKKRIHVELTGGRTPDEKIANRLCGFDERPRGYTWHHDAITGDMMLVPSELHRAVSHTGDAAVWRHVNGVEEYGQ